CNNKALLRGYRSTVQKARAKHTSVVIESYSKRERRGAASRGPEKLDVPDLHHVPAILSVVGYPREPGKPKEDLNVRHRPGRFQVGIVLRIGEESVSRLTAVRQIDGGPVNTFGALDET